MTNRTKNVRRTGHAAPLDRIDRAIVVEVQKNGRISNKELAATVGLSESSCLERLRRLRARGVVRGFHAEVDLVPLGRSIQAIIAVRLAVHHREAIDRFYAHAIELAESLAVFHVGGSDDYLVHVAVRDADHLRDLVLEDFTARPEVSHVETRLIFEHIRKPVIEPLDP